MSMEGGTIIAFALGNLQDRSTTQTLINGADLARSQQRSEAAQLERLATALQQHGRAAPALVPMLFDAEPGMETTRRVGEHLTEEWDL